MNPKEKRVEIDPNFRRKLFKEHGSVTNLSKKLKISRITLSSFKNNYLKTIPYELFKKICQAFHISKEERDKYIRCFYTHKEICHKGLIIGRNLRKNQLKSWKKEIPSIEQIVNKNELNLEKWFESYLKLTNFGCRSFRKLVKKKNKIKIEYYNYSNSKKKLFRNILPRKIKIDKNFQYFFGLWCGDRVGKGRFGIVNQNKDINLITIKYLKKIYQKSKSILMINPIIRTPKLKIKIDKIIKNDKSFKGYSICVFSQNNILFTFFDYLYKDLNTILNILPNKNIFFAGLFDAEGNVSLYNRSFRWACKNNKLVSIYSKFLQELNLYKRYDGSCLISYNKKEFYNKIFPYLKHEEKINDAKILCKGIGRLTKTYLEILKRIKECPNKTAKEISKALKKDNIYTELKLLNDFQFISHKDYPYKFKITIKGLMSLGGQNYH